MRGSARVATSWKPRDPRPLESVCVEESPRNRTENNNSTVVTGVPHVELCDLETMYGPTAPLGSRDSPRRDSRDRSRPPPHTHPPEIMSSGGTPCLSTQGSKGVNVQEGPGLPLVTVMLRLIPLPRRWLSRTWSSPPLPPNTGEGALERHGFPDRALEFRWCTGGGHGAAAEMSCGLGPAPSPESTPRRGIVSARDPWSSCKILADSDSRPFPARPTSPLDPGPCIPSVVI